MGFKMLVPIILSLIGAIYAESPYADFRSNMEILQYDTNLDEPAYRLLDNVQPRHVDLELDVYLQESRIEGSVNIVVEVQESLEQIVVHQKVVAIHTVHVLNAGTNQPVPLQFPQPFETDDYYEILKINLAVAITPGTYVISITYTGRINENPIDRGFYKGYYFLNNEVRQYATTQFQPYHARKAFPCFDEPQFKARYNISITRDSSLSPSYSNMAIDPSQTQQIGGRTRENFFLTPLISVYLIAFHVSDFVETTATGTAARPFGVVSRQGATNQHDYAARTGVRITQALDDYLDYGYYTMGQGQSMKNDHIALPDFPSGAMENWGMVNYREAYLLYDESHTNVINKIFIATIIAHEMAHKWFGNLVTCFWWSNLWLNESYASYFEYFAAHWADTTLELDEQFIVDYVHSALSWDAGAGATPMNHGSVASNPSISNHFSTTSYAKGASVLRMMEHFVGSTIFRDALRIYLTENAYELGTPQAMYNAFRQAVATDPTFAQTYPGVDVGAVFESWVETPGSPVLNVEVDMSTGDVTVTQQRFQLTTPIPNSVWQVPVSWTHGGAANFDTKPAFVLTGPSDSFNKGAGHDWVLLNNAQSGLYRVNYDEHNWEHIAEALHEENHGIHKMNRAQIVNDVLFFMRADQISKALGFKILSFLEHETDYYVWAGALGQLDWFLRRLRHIPEAYSEFQVYLGELMAHVIEDLGYAERTGDSTSVILNRMQIMNYACNTLFHEGCIEYSLERWRQLRANPTNLVNVNERRYVYCVGVREGDNSDYNFLWDLYINSENTADMVVILRALACTKNSALLETYLQQSMENDRIRIHDKTNAFSFALLGNDENVVTVLSYLYRNYDRIRETYGGEDRANIAINALAAHLTDFEHITEFQLWLYANQINLRTSFTTGVSVINTSMNNLHWGNNAVVDIYTFLLGRSSATSITISFAVLMTALVAHFF